MTQALSVAIKITGDLMLALSDAERERDEAMAEVARLQDVVGQQPHTAYLEAVQRACDERMVALKHEARDWQARAEAAERQLAGVQAMSERIVALENQLADMRQECMDKIRDRNRLREQLAEARRKLAEMSSVRFDGFGLDVTQVQEWFRRRVDLALAALAQTEERNP